MKKVRYVIEIIVGTILSLGLSLCFMENGFALDDSDIIISAVTAIDAGEFIEIKRLPNDSILLTGLSIRYVNSAGSEKVLYEFADGTLMTGESLLLKFNKAEDAEKSDIVYKNGASGLAMSAGKVELVFEEEVIDEVCWGDIDGCVNKSFDKKKPTTLVRNMETMEFAHDEEYVPTWEEERKVLEVPEGFGEDTEVKAEEEVIEPHCKGLEFSEILTYYETGKSEQFIELYNGSSSQVVLNGCSVRYKNKLYALEGVVPPEGYFVRYATDFTLTKNPTNYNTIEIIDENGDIVDSLTYHSGQKKAVAYARFGYTDNGEENWMQTYAPTPGEENNYQKYKTCPEGKVINEETGNCVNVTKLNTGLETCPAGSYRNPLTNRCKKYASTASSELKPCADGYERNPETNRCRKIVSNDGASYPVATENFEEKSSFIAIWAIVGVGVVGAGYVIFQYRKEIAGVFRKR